MTTGAIQSGSGTQPAGGWPASNSSDVNTAADKIESLIDSEGASEWADRAEVTEAANTLAGLDPQVADAVKPSATFPMLPVRIITDASLAEPKEIIEIKTSLQ